MSGHVYPPAHHDDGRYSSGGRRHKKHRGHSEPLIRPSQQGERGPGGYHPLQPNQQDTIYEDIDHNLRRPGPNYGATPSPTLEVSKPSTVPESKIRSASSYSFDTTDGRSHHALVSPLVQPTGTIVRDIPCQLPDGNETEVHYVSGQYTKIVVLVLFFSLIPFGLCFLAFLPFCLKCKWSKDINHIDPVSRVSIGRFRRGTIDAQQVIRYHRPVQKEGRGGRSVSRQPSTIQQQIELGRQPVTLPDQTTTVVQKRIGYGNQLGAITTLLTCAFLPLGWPILPLLVLSCYCMSCLQDTEHLHRQTGNVVGVYYRCQS